MALISLLADGMVMVDCGPLTATVSASRFGLAHTRASVAGAEAGIRILHELSQNMTAIKTQAAKLADTSEFPGAVADMIAACCRVRGEELTPLAAVAGGVADHMADCAVSAGATRVVVDNGGDIAIRVRGDAPVRVGLGGAADSAELPHMYCATSDCGICTSGVGGRSFTLGVADVVTVLAEKASLADAAATWIGDQCNIDSPMIVRQPAEALYSDTDIPGMLVTVAVGALSETEIQEALDRAERVAIELHYAGVILGTFLSLRGHERRIGRFQESTRVLVSLPGCHQQGNLNQRMRAAGLFCT